MKRIIEIKKEIEELILDGTDGRDFITAIESDFDEDCGHFLTVVTLWNRREIELTIRVIPSPGIMRRQGICFETCEDCYMELKGNVWQALFRSCENTLCSKEDEHLADLYEMMGMNKRLHDLEGC